MPHTRQAQHRRIQHARSVLHGCAEPKASQRCTFTRSLPRSAARHSAGVATNIRRPRSVQARAQSPPAPLRIPQSIHEVDNGNILGFGESLSEDHPGGHDDEYKTRRWRIAQEAKQHRVGDPIPRVDYEPYEIDTWAHVMAKLDPLIHCYACREFIEAYSAFDFHPDRIPQLSDVQGTLNAATGWDIRPVAGLMHPRDFLAGLAYKTFHSTQYIRHHSQPMYTPEPDVVHEILGHVPMLINPEYCKMVEMIGRASLGASDKEIWHLTKVYWYTVEFGVVKESEAFKAFGAGILSSYGELDWMGSGQATISRFDPWSKLPKMSYKDGFQQQYFCLDSFEEGARLLTTYAQQSRKMADA